MRRENPEAIAANLVALVGGVSMFAIAINGFMKLINYMTLEMYIPSFRAFMYIGTGILLVVFIYGFASRSMRNHRARA